MVFLNIYLLGGLALLGVPVVLHFWMRQKPRRLPFPAFRFLRQRSVVNRRRMRLQHLLLLALRMLVLAALCFAIAQPKLFLPRAAAKWFGLSSPRPAAAVFVFDVSYRMEYRVGGLSRLDDARQRALDLLHNLPAESQVAVLDTGADGADDEADEDWIPSLAQVRSRINGLRLRPIRAPLVRQIEKAADLLAKAGQAGEPSSRMLYGGRVDLLIAFGATAVTLVVGTAIGLFSGYVGGWIDATIMRIVDLFFAFPFFVLATVPNFVPASTHMSVTGSQMAVRAPVVALALTAPKRTRPSSSTMEMQSPRMKSKPGVGLFIVDHVPETGSKISPGLFESLELLGKDRSLERLRAAAGLAPVQSG